MCIAIIIYKLLFIIIHLFCNHSIFIKIKKKCLDLLNLLLNKKNIYLLINSLSLRRMLHDKLLKQY